MSAENTVGLCAFPGNLQTRLLSRIRAPAPSQRKMFAPRKPDPELAKKELRTHALYLAGWVVAIRVLPYLLHFSNRPSSSS